jgi:hypothetical protein
MKKIWIVFVLVLVISSQLLVMSLFRQVDDNGFTTNNSVITIAKWNYVDASVTITIVPMVENGAINASVTLPNGTTINLTSYYPFRERFNFPRTGDFIGNEALSGPFSISQDKPVAVLITPNVGNAQDYISSLDTIKQQNPGVDLLNFIVYGQAQVSVSVYGVIL